MIVDKGHLTGEKWQVTKWEVTGEHERCQLVIVDRHIYNIYYVKKVLPLLKK